MRTYQPIWEALKRDGICVVRANPALFPRIRKAVIKEKWLDIDWRESGFTKIVVLFGENSIEFRLRDYRHINIILAYEKAIHLGDRKE